jgi:hypothetical protein
MKPSSPMQLNKGTITHTLDRSTNFELTQDRIMQDTNTTSNSDLKAERPKAIRFITRAKKERPRESSWPAGLQEMRLMLAATVGNALHDRPVETKVLLVYFPPAGRACLRACACVRETNESFCATAALFRRAGKSVFVELCW